MQSLQDAQQKMHYWLWESAQTAKTVWQGEQKERRKQMRKVLRKQKIIGLFTIGVAIVSLFLAKEITIALFLIGIGLIPLLSQEVIIR